MEYSRVNNWRWQLSVVSDRRGEGGGEEGGVVLWRLMSKFKKDCRVVWYWILILWLIINPWLWYQVRL